MGLSIQRLRWVLAAGALLLIAVLAVYIGYGRYRMLSAYRQILARSGATISRDSNGVTYSQSVGGKKVFTLRAVKETSLGNGRWALHDADLLLYTRSAEHPDHIYGKDFEYDEKTGVTRALGEVFMDLQAPEALAGKNAGEQPHRQLSAGPAGSEPATAVSSQGPIIHVRTSGLVYLRKLGVAATEQEVEFDYRGMHCTALGAEFNTGQNVLHLLSHVTMDGTAHGQPVHLTAVKADLDRTANMADLTQPVVISGDRRAKADEAVLNLRKDGSIEQAHGIGSVVLTEGTRQVMAQRLDAALSPQAVLQTARLSGGVALVDSSTQRPMRGSANEVNAVFDAQGAPAKVVATGAAQVSMVDHANPSAGAHGLERGMQGHTITALLVPGARKGTSQLSEVHATGAAQMRGEALVIQAKSSLLSKPQSPKLRQTSIVGAPEFKTVQVAADDLRVTFVEAGANRVEPQRLYGTGHTLLQQDAPLGEQEISRGDTLEAVFATGLESGEPTRRSAPGVQVTAARAGASGAARKEPLTIVSAVQVGHVTVVDRSASKEAAAHEQPAGVAGAGEVSTGSAERAIYDGATQRVTLSGEARIESGNVSLVAPTVILDQETGNAEASGGVSTTLLNTEAEQISGQGPGQGGSRGSSGSAEGHPEPVTHVLSASAMFDHMSKMSEFRGSDSAPAKMWQDASQVEAAVLVLNGAHHTFSARPGAAGALVHAVFAGSPAEPKTNADGNAERRSSRAQEGKRSAAHEGPGQGPATDFVRVASPKMDYNDLLREATFAGGVRIDGTMGEVRGQRATVFLMPAAKAGEGKQVGTAQARQTGQSPTASTASPAGLFGGSLDRVIVSGDVRMEQPGRQGTGEQLLYTAATGSYVLTGLPGHPPRIVDAQQGSVTGTTLVFSDAGSTIVVAGAPGAKSGQGRVRTETEVRQ